MRLDGDVQGGDGFVADDEARLEGQGPGDADALALSAREFVGVTIEISRAEADTLEEVGDFLVEGPTASDVVDLEGLGDNGLYGHAGIQ